MDELRIYGLAILDLTFLCIEEELPWLLWLMQAAVFVVPGYIGYRIFSRG